jgi:hypothetical protein
MAIVEYAGVRSIAEYLDVTRKIRRDWPQDEVADRRGEEENSGSVAKGVGIGVYHRNSSESRSRAQMRMRSDWNSKAKRSN